MRRSSKSHLGCVEEPSVDIGQVMFQCSTILLQMPPSVNVQLLTFLSLDGGKHLLQSRLNDDKCLLKKLANVTFNEDLSSV